jgi:murein DD-endopeptidase MepM/ murein hydrolase activator NlpD
MIKTTIILPQVFRLGLDLSKLRVKGSVAKGNRFSRIGRKIFEHNNLRAILGSHLALAAVATSALSVPSYAKNDINNLGNITTRESVLIRTMPGVKNPLAYMKINTKFSFYHPGIDLEGLTGDPVKPIMGGFVQHTQYSRYAYGNAIIVNHGNGITSLYAHLSKINVKQGQNVTTDTTIGLVGSTGRSTGDHLHLEVRDNNVAINPLSVLPH